MILGFDTAGPVIGVAVLDGESVQVRTERVARGAEGRLVPWALALAGDLGRVTAIAVTVGPGAFTGVRVGLATATGLALALGVPVWATDSLRTRASRVEGERVLSLLDARKDRFYGAWYARGVLTEGPRDLRLGELLAGARAPFVATGEGAVVGAAAIAAAGGVIAPAAEDPAVDALVRLAAVGLARGEGSDPQAVAPMYLREPDAVVPRERG